MPKVNISSLSESNRNQSNLKLSEITEAKISKMKLLKYVSALATVFSGSSLALEL